jgi:hypothetical protein
MIGVQKAHPGTKIRFHPTTMPAPWRSSCFLKAQSQSHLKQSDNVPSSYLFLMFRMNNI